MSSSPSNTSRRRFIRNLSGAAVAASAATSAYKVMAASPEDGASAGNLDSIRRWVASGADWKSLREHFLLEPKIAYFNTGSLGACPRAVVDAHIRYLQEVEHNPADLLFGSMGEQMETVRKSAADFLGADVDEIALTANTTTGMNLVAEALPLGAGDEVLTTNQEHPGGRVCWDYAKARRGIVIREINLEAAVENEAKLLDAFESAITERTKAISISHVSTISGAHLPVFAISQLARKRGIFVAVDGAQAAGMLNLDLHELGCDAYAMSGHKWMLAPKGTGVLYLRKESQSRLSSVYLASGLRAYTAASGTRNVPQILAQGAALDFLQTLGSQRIEERTLFLAGILRRRLEALPEIKVASPADARLQSAIVTLQLPSQNAAAVSHQLLERHQIVVKTVPGPHLQGRGIRVSTHFYNTEAEIEKFASALATIVKGG